MAHENDWVINEAGGIPTRRTFERLYESIDGLGEWVADKDGIFNDDYWPSKTWNGLTSFNGSGIWTDGENIYYSYRTDQYVLDKATGRWTSKTWSGLSSINGDYIWTDGENIYYSMASTQYVLDKSTSTWTTKTWTGLTSFYGYFVWTDGENIYYSYKTDQYVLDKATGRWTSKTWKVMTSFYGSGIWTDGENIYYSEGTRQAILDKSTSTWSVKTWNGLTNFDGVYIWKYNGTIYVTPGDRQTYVLDVLTSTWSEKKWSPSNSNIEYGSYIWIDGENIYYSEGTKQYQFKPKKVKNTYPYRLDFSPVVESFGNGWILFRDTPAKNTWTNYPQPGATEPLQAGNIWTDGTHIYYSQKDMQYVLNSNNEWEPTVWNWTHPEWPLTGAYIWTAGGNIYYSNSNLAYDNETGSWEYGQFKFNPETNLWDRINWRQRGAGDYFDSNHVWTDGTDIYLSRQFGLGTEYKNYKFDAETETWIEYPFNGLFTEISGSYVWSWRGDVYYTQKLYNYSKQYIYNRSENKWESKTWKGTNFFDRYDIWFDEEDTMYLSSNKANQYIFDESSNSFVPMVWYGEGSFLRGYRYIWVHDGVTYYLDSANNEQKKLVMGFRASDPPYRFYYPELVESLDFGDIWLIDNDIPYRYECPELKESFNVGGEWFTQDEPDTSSTKKYLKFTHTVTATFTAGNRAPTVSYDFSDSEYYTTPRYYDQGVSSWSNIYGRIFVPANAKVRKDEWDLSNTDIYGIMNPSGPNYFKKLDGYSETIDPTSDKLHYDSGDYYWAYPSRDYGTNKYYIEFSLAMLRQLTPSESGSTTITFSHIFEFDSENEDYRAFLEVYPNNVEPWYPMRKAVPYRLDFPAFNSSIPGSDIWLIDDEYPYRVDFPLLYESSGGATSWLQDKGWDPRRPWPDHRSIIQKVQTIPNIPDVDWTKSMQQTFEFYTVDPNNWYDDQKLENIISCDLTHDLTSDKRGNASISITEPLPECYIRTYLVVTQAGYMHKICLGTYLYMTSSDSFDGMKHNITMTGYTPMVELEEKLPPLGFHIVGITNRKHSGDAPMVTDAIKDIVTTYTRCEIENRTVIQKPLLNDFVAGSNDNFLTVINNLLNASSLQQYILTVDEWGTIIVKDKPVLEDAIPTYIYTDDNSSILLPSLDTNDDIYGIPNVVEVLYTGDKRLPAIRVIVKNEDSTSIVSIPARGREIAKRFTITNIAAPVNDYSEAAVRAQVTAQAERLLEAASTINKTISYSHGYCDVKVGDTVLINYERAGVTGIRAKVVSQRISCKPGCQVDEQAVYTKKLWNRGV